MLDLHDREWKEFYLRDIFPDIQRGKRLKTADHIQGSIPYVSSSAINNGVDAFIGNGGKVRKFEECLTLANSGSVGKTFYHSYEFIASDHVTSLKSDKLNKYSYLFIATIVQRLEEKYSFNREINDGLTTNKTEGDHMTPEGTFPIYFAFSTKAKNTKIAFETISEDSVWVCDPESVYYNTLQSKNNPDKDWADKGGAENMYPKFSKGSSNACICFGFNGDGWSPYGAVAYGGSALFIDGVGENGKMNSGYGDIKISGKDMTKLLSYLDSDCNPTITIRAAQ